MNSSFKQGEVEKHFDRIANSYDYFKNKNQFYYQNLKKLLSFLIPGGSEVLEYGCGTGDLIVYLKPKLGIGYDLSTQMVKIAREKYSRYKNMTFVNDVSIIRKRFDFVFMSDVIEHLEDPVKHLKVVSKFLKKDGKFVCTMANPLWEPILIVAEKLKLKMPEGKHFRWGMKQVNGFAKKAGMELIKHNYELLLPIYLPFISGLINRYLESIFKRFCFIEYAVFKKS